MAVRDTTDALQLAGNLAFLAGGMDADDLIGETVRSVIRDSSHVITFTYQDANGDIQTIAMPTLVSLDLNGSVVVASLGDGTSVSVDLSPLQTGVVVPNYTRYITISDDGTFTGASFLDPNTGGSSSRKRDHDPRVRERQPVRVVRDPDGRGRAGPRVRRRRSRPECVRVIRACGRNGRYQHGHVRRVAHAQPVGY